MVNESELSALAKECVDNLDSLIDGQDDELAEILTSVRDFCSRFVKPQPATEFTYLVNLSVCVGSDVEEPATAIEAALTKTVANNLWQNLPGALSPSMDDKVIVYSIVISQAVSSA